MNNLEEQVRDVKGIIEKYWETHEGCEPAEPSREITACIDSLVSEYGYRNVADAFGIKTKQFYLNFDEYTTDAESFESDMALTESVLQTRARYHFCGHIHTGNHAPCCYKNGTMGVNVSMLDEGYEAHYESFWGVID